MTPGLPNPTYILRIIKPADFIPELEPIPNLILMCQQVQEYIIHSEAPGIVTLG
jgi:hypothetical protein